MYYASFGMLSIVLHLIINYEAICNPRDDKKTGVWKHYRLFLLGIMLYYVSDVLWGLLYDLKIVPLVYADTVLYFFSMALSLFLWMRFTVSYLNRRDGFSDILIYAGWGIFILNILTLIANFFTPIMFSFAADGEYFPAQARYINLGIQFFLFLVLAVYSLTGAISAEGHDKHHCRAIGFSGIVMAVLIVLQTMYPLLPFYAIGCLIANCVIHSFVEVDVKLAKDTELGTVKVMVYNDPLTNVKNARAYAEEKADYDLKISNRELDELAIMVFDLNNLKSVNDTLGHEAGDKYLKEASRLICSIYKHSPVFRIGGDEFVTLLTGEDYINKDALLRIFNAQVDYNMRNGGPVVAAGIGVYSNEKDTGFDDVFDRADEKMYQRKKELKEG